jgi:hypothetical protein
MILWHPARIDERPKGVEACPYFEWTRATGFAYYDRSAKWLPVLIELQDTPNLRGNARAFAQHVLRLQQGRRPGWAAEVRLPPFAAMPPAWLQTQPRFVSVLVTPTFLDRLYAGKQPSASIRRFELGRSTPPSAGAPSKAMAAAPVAAATAQVVLGVIDDGIPFAHDRYFSGDGTTRIEYFWDQSQPSSTWGDWGYGNQIDKAQIDQHITASTHGPQGVDEDEVYRRSGHLVHLQPGHKPLAARASHGAHVLDLACNAPWPFAPQPPAAGARPIVAVQLPIDTVADTSGATLEPQIYNGLCYILDRATALAARRARPPLPVVVNVSYGLIAGPHDGTGMLEQAMNDLIQCCTMKDVELLRVVLPAGNSHLSRCHASFALPKGAKRELAWRVLPDDRTESHVEIWLPAGADVNTLSIAINAPDGSTSTGPFVAGESWTATASGAPIGKACYYPATQPMARPHVTLWIAPTARPDADVPTAPAGLWRIEIDNSAGAAAVAPIDAWIQRDDTAPGYPRRGRQSYFDDPDYLRYDNGGRAIEVDSGPSCIRREGLLNAIATGSLPVVVGGFRRSDRNVAAYSAGGPLPPPGRGAPNPDGPDALLPSEDAPSMRGVLAAGTRSNSCVAMQGTSVAAPQAAFWIAEKAALKLPSDRNFIFNGAQAHESGNPPPPLPRFGGGRIPNPSNRPPRAQR